MDVHLFFFYPALKLIFFLMFNIIFQIDDNDKRPHVACEGTVNIQIYVEANKLLMETVTALDTTEVTCTSLPLLMPASLSPMLLHKTVSLTVFYSGM